jgi:peptide-methionine (S)-S-oxide reductase
MNRAQRWIAVASIALSLGYVWLRGGFVGVFARPAEYTEREAQSARNAAASKRQTAVFAGGCFWSVESDFDTLKGVISTTSGYTGGRVRNPTYDQVSRGGTGHAEAVEVTFDPGVVTYEQVLEHYWRHIDPFVGHRQFCDVGDEYRPEIFVRTPEQRAAADGSLAAMRQRFEQPILVRVTDAGPFYRAEDYHQNYYQNNSIQYRYYRWRCGRDARLAQIWGSS